MFSFHLVEYENAKCMPQMTQAYLEPSQIFKTELFSKIVNG